MKLPLVLLYTAWGMLRCGMAQGQADDYAAKSPLAEAINLMVSGAEDGTVQLEEALAISPDVNAVIYQSEDVKSNALALCISAAVEGKPNAFAALDLVLAHAEIDVNRPCTLIETQDGVEKQTPLGLALTAAESGHKGGLNIARTLVARNETDVNIAVTLPDGAVTPPLVMLLPIAIEGEQGAGEASELAVEVVRAILAKGMAHVNAGIRDAASKTGQALTPLFMLLMANRFGSRSIPIELARALLARPDLDVKQTYLTPKGPHSSLYLAAEAVVEEASNMTRKEILYKLAVKGARLLDEEVQSSEGELLELVHNVLTFQFEKGIGRPAGEKEAADVAASLDALHKRATQQKALDLERIDEKKRLVKEKVSNEVHGIVQEVMQSQVDEQELGRMAATLSNLTEAEMVELREGHEKLAAKGTTAEEAETLKAMIREINKKLDPMSGESQGKDEL